LFNGFHAIGGFSADFKPGMFQENSNDVTHGIAIIDH
jgi:hypothetical protein